MKLWPFGHRKGVPESVRNFDFAQLDQDWLSQTVKSSVPVSHSTSLYVSAVLACVRVIAEGVADLPLHVYRQLADGVNREVARDGVGSRLNRLLSAAPNEQQTAYEFFEMMTMQAALTGSAYAFKNVVDGQIRELLPLNPGAVTVTRVNGVSTYQIADADEGIAMRVSADQLLILRGPGLYNRLPLDLVRQAREAIGLAVAAEESQAKLHANGGQPNGILTTDSAINEDARKRLKEAWESSFKGKNKYKTAVLDGGWKYQGMGMTGVDSQHLETRRFQIEEICRAFKVFPQMIMHTDKTSTYASAESFFGAHVKHTISPWCTRWEQALDRDVLDGKGPLFAKFDKRELLKASMKDRGDFYRTVAELGIYTRNELRELEGLTPLEGLDEPLTPLNMQGSNDGKEVSTDQV